MTKEERRVLDNGLIAIADPMHGKKLAVLRLGILLGAKDEAESKSGMSHFLEHMLFRSNKHLTTNEFGEAIEFNGMDFNACTGKTETQIIFSLPREKLPLAIKMMNYLISDDQYTQSEFEIEKGVILSEMAESNLDNDEIFEKEIFYPFIFEGSPMAKRIIGNCETVSNMKLSDIISLKRRFYIPNNMVLVASGAVNPNQFFKETEKRFGKVKGKKVHHKGFNWKFVPRDGYIEVPNFKNRKNRMEDIAYVYCAFKVNGVNNEDALGLALLECMLGVGETSLLYRKVRKERGLSYDVDVGYLSFRDNAIMLTGIPGAHPSKIEEITDLLGGIIVSLPDVIKNRRFFEGKKNQLISSYQNALDTALLRSASLIKREFECPHYDFRELPEAVKGITQESLIDIVIRNFSNDPSLMVASAPGYKNAFNT